MNIVGSPALMSVASRLPMPGISSCSISHPVGKVAPVADPPSSPAGSRNSSRISAAGKATPSSRYPRIRIIPLVEPAATRSLVLIAPRNAHLSPAAQALYDMLIRHAGAREPGRVAASDAHS